MLINRGCIQPLHKVTMFAVDISAPKNASGSSDLTSVAESQSVQRAQMMLRRRRIILGVVLLVGAIITITTIVGLTSHFSSTTVATESDYSYPGSAYTSSFQSEAVEESGQLDSLQGRHQIRGLPSSLAQFLKHQVLGLKPAGLAFIAVSVAVVILGVVATVMIVVYRRRQDGIHPPPPSIDPDIPKARPIFGWMNLLFIVVPVLGCLVIVLLTFRQQIRRTACGVSPGDVTEHRAVLADKLQQMRALIVNKGNLVDVEVATTALWAVGLNDRFQAQGYILVGRALNDIDLALENIFIQQQAQINGIALVAEHHGHRRIYFPDDPRSIDEQYNVLLQQIAIADSAITKLNSLQ